MPGIVKRIGSVGVGLAAVGAGYWFGFVGQTETKWMMGPEGYGLYEVTRTNPLAGLALLLVGFLAIGKGIRG